MSTIVYIEVVEHIPRDYWSYANLADNKPP